MEGQQPDARQSLYESILLVLMNEEVDISRVKNAGLGGIPERTVHGKRDACIPGAKKGQEPGWMHRDVTAMVLYEQGISPQRCDESNRHQRKL